MAQCIRTCLCGRSCACAHADHAHCPLSSNDRHMSVLPGCFSAEPLNPISEGAVRLLASQRSALGPRAKRCVTTRRGSRMIELLLARRSRGDKLMRSARFGFGSATSECSHAGGSNQAWERLMRRSSPATEAPPLLTARLACRCRQCDAMRGPRNWGWGGLIMIFLPSSR